MDRHTRGLAPGKHFPGGEEALKHTHTHIHTQKKVIYTIFIVFYAFFWHPARVVSRGGAGGG